MTARDKLIEKACRRGELLRPVCPLRGLARADRPVRAQEVKR